MKRAHRNTNTENRQPMSRDDEDEMWEGLVPLHVEKIVDPLAPTFDFQLLSKRNKQIRTFSIVQDLEGRRKPATTDTIPCNDERKHGTAIAEEGLTEHKSKTGAVVWDGAVVAAGMLDNAATNGATELPLLDPRDKTIIELGCGCAALPGMVALASGAEQVILTDLEPIIESEALATNLNNNLTEDELSKVTKLVYRWGDDQFDLRETKTLHTSRGPIQLFSYHKAAVDLILACDTVYDMALVEPLLDSILFLMRKSNEFKDSSSNCKALVCYDESIGRKKAYRFFQEEAKKRFAVVQDLTESEKRHDLRPDSVTALSIMYPIRGNKDDTEG